MSHEPPLDARDPPTRPGSPSLDERILAAIESKDHAESVRLNTEGITLYPQDPKYLLDRATANFHLGNFREATADALNALKLNLDNKIHLSSPYLMLARALVGLREYDFAFTIAELGHKIDPMNFGMKECLVYTRIAGAMKREDSRRKQGKKGIGDTFVGGEMWLKLEGDEEAKSYRHDPEFRRKIHEARNNNLILGKHLREDKRVLKSLGILLHMRFGETIWGGELDTEIERLGIQDDEDANNMSEEEKLRRDAISRILMIPMPVLMKHGGLLEKQIGDRKLTEEEVAEEAELAKEIWKVVPNSTGATIAEGSGVCSSPYS